MAAKTESGVVLTSNFANVDELAIRIANMWNNFNTARTEALRMSEEVREYIHSTDINTTSARDLPHKNRTHQPKLTQISDNLQSQYWDAAFSGAQFFKYDGTTSKDREIAGSIEAWIRTKLEAKKFRQTVGRQIIADYVQQGNCFLGLDMVTELGHNGNLVYKGPLFRRIGPMDIVFDLRAVSFAKSPKIERQLVHIAEVLGWPEAFPLGGFNKAKIKEVANVRQPNFLSTWLDIVKERGLAIDGFSDFNAYFTQDMVEVLIYRGNIFDPETGETAKNRVIYVVDRTHVIRNEPSNSPVGFDGLHHAGWRTRPDNLWGQGPLDNLVGMQYRVDHLENLVADIFDQIAHPVLLIKGENVIEPASGYAPGATYHAGVDEDVKVLSPDATALQGHPQIQTYHRMMEEFAGAPPESAGIRTPGEKTAFEVNKLDSNATKMFVDKVRALELMIETALEEAYISMINSFDRVDFMETMDDLGKAQRIEEITEVDQVMANGQFVALGSSHWSRRNRETVEMLQFQQGPLQDPKVRAHINGQKLAEFYEKRMGIEDDEIVEPFAGVLEDAKTQIMGQAELARLSQAAQDEGGVDLQPPEGATAGAAPQGAQPAQGGKPA